MGELFDIGFTGKAGAGKDTAAKFVYDSSVKYVRRAFADALKNIAKQAGWNGVKDNAGRMLLQDIGMAVRRYNPDAWVEIAERWPARERTEVPIIWTDVRFANEAEFVKRRGGIIIRIDRPEPYGSGMNELTAGHISEMLYGINPSYIINNDSTLPALKEQVLAVVKLEMDLRLEKRLKQQADPAENK